MACAIRAFTLVATSWLAALIVSTAVGLAAGVLALVDKKQVQAAVPPVPESTVANVTRDAETLKGRTASMSSTPRKVTNTTAAGGTPAKNAGGPAPSITPAEIQREIEHTHE